MLATFQLKNQERRLSKLVDEDEIAKSFLRQREFRGKKTDSLEMQELARKLKGDVDEAWRRKVEDMAGRNPNEIREEYRLVFAILACLVRWLRAVQDSNHRRRVRAERKEKRKKDELAAEGLSSTKMSVEEKPN
ncbi:unnamed protein product [Strongylus vulgaris]|uniref:Uncharacterized protein n=1 Tax=Strongylus vulgaris TaxID=40348 RepID=A0A3P7JAF2_STRVU|nr:unnamed protein product [Strongylus vulgaris]